MPLGEAVSDVKEVAMDVAFIVAGAFVGRMALQYIGNAVPQVRQFGPYGAIVLGALGAAYTSGIIRKLMMGVATAGGLGAAEMLLNQPAVIRNS